jgi:hypothetical protein
MGSSLVEVSPPMHAFFDESTNTLELRMFMALPANVTIASMYDGDGFGRTVFAVARGELRGLPEENLHLPTETALRDFGWFYKP